MQPQKTLEDYLHILIKDDFEHIRFENKFNKSSNSTENSSSIFIFILVHTSPEGIDKRKTKKMRGALLTYNYNNYLKGPLDIGSGIS